MQHKYGLSNKCHICFENLSFSWICMVSYNLARLITNDLNLICSQWILHQHSVHLWQNSFTCVLLVQEAMHGELWCCFPNFEEAVAVSCRAPTWTTCVGWRCSCSHVVYKNLWCLSTGRFIHIRPNNGPSRLFYWKTWDQTGHLALIIQRHPLPGLHHFVFWNWAFSFVLMWL